MLRPGTRLGSYEIAGPLGAGGMGEVYRAKDATLSREVAVKILPEGLAADAAALRRFEREARAVAALSHPNVLAIFDFGSHDGIAYAVTELLEGETLRARLSGAPLLPRRAAEIAHGIALGLAAAHEKGIVHRDLKPENVFLTKDGRVKVLDFGLAKQVGLPVLPDDASRAQTVEHDTEPGTVLGTVGYMAPEQVRGLSAGPRADVFALGAILYEMLAGRRAFRGASAVETMSAILREEPPDLLETNRPASPALERIVRRCLEKTPEQRFHSGADVAFALDAISGTSVTAPGGRAHPEAREAGRGRTARALLAASVVAGAVVAAFALGRAGGRKEPPTFKRLTYQNGVLGSARFSPDGQTAVFSAGFEGKPWQTYSTRLDGREARLLGLPPGEVLAISGSGDIAFLTGERRFWRPGLLAVVPLSGGAPRELATNVKAAAFAPDGSLAAARRVGGRSVIELPLGTVRHETNGLVYALSVSADGKLLAFLEYFTGGHAVHVLDLGSNAARLVSGGWAALVGRPVWGADGEELFISGSRGLSPPAIHGIDRAGKTRLVMQLPTALTLEDITGAGRALVTSFTWRSSLVTSTASNPAERDLSWLDWSTVKDISDDGKTILFDEQREGGGLELSVYVRKTDGSPAVRLGEGEALALSADGARVLAMLPKAKPPALVLWPTGAGTPLRIPLGGLVVTEGRFTSDGRRLVFAARLDTGSETRIYTLDLPDGKPRPLTPAVRGALALSGDDTRVAVRTLEGPLAIYPVAGGDPSRVPGTDARDSPLAFTTDGTLFVRHEGFPTPIFRLNVETGTRTPFKELGPADLAGVTAISPVVISPDGRSYAYCVKHHPGSLYVVEGLE